MTGSGAGMGTLMRLAAGFIAWVAAAMVGAGITLVLLLGTDFLARALAFYTPTEDDGLETAAVVACWVVLSGVYALFSLTLGAALVQYLKAFPGHRGRQLFMAGAGGGAALGVLTALVVCGNVWVFVWLAGSMAAGLGLGWWLYVWLAGWTGARRLNQARP